MTLWRRCENSQMAAAGWLIRTSYRPGKITTNRIELSLFDLEKDIGETTNVADAHSDVVARLLLYAEGARADLGDAATQRKGSGVREPGRLSEAN